MDIFQKPAVIDEDVVKNLGPFSPLAGVWEGDQGVDVSPSKHGPVETRYRERITLDPFGPVVNGPQVLYGLKYAATAWPLGEKKAFHEETGYWLWDAKERQIMRCFIVPRGVTVNAGGHADLHSTTLEMSAEAGSEIYGILSNPFLNDAFKTVRYDVRITLHGDGGFSYAEDTVLKLFGQDELFHHTDQNRLTRCS
ncbi:MAG: heme-binding beta-barrel domain-containing protein [Nitrospiria bacterium]